MSTLAGPSVNDDNGHPGRDEGYTAGDRVLRVAPWKTPRQTLGQRLRAQRERRGIPLEVIAESSKIKVSLLVDLERDDFSKWPHGVFGRGFVRAYATAIGLAPGPVLAEFAELRPDEREGCEVAHATHNSDDDLRLTLAGDGRAVLAQVTQRCLGAAIEAGALVAAGFLAAGTTQGNPWAISGVIALGYYAASAAALGQSPSQWWLLRHRCLAMRRAEQRTAATPRPPLHLIISRSGPDAEQSPPQASARS